jgi:predicted Zn-dependent protease
MKKQFAIFFTAAILFSACSKVPITERRQFSLLPESQLIGMSLDQYGKYISENKVVPDSDPRTKMVKGMGERMKNAVIDYMKQNGLEKRVSDFVWEFNLVDDPLVNAWCMPGGKVVVYTGLLNVSQTEDGLAVVMGHEIAHAVARHGNERMSQQMAINATGLSLSALLNEKPEQAQGLFNMAYGVGSQVGMLSFSRNHETEADRLGLIFSAMAGYNPNEAPKFWERMSAASGGGAPPEFFRTHPSHETRIENLTKFIPEAMQYYKPR